MRLFFALILALCICVSIFFGMHLMTSSNNSNISKSSQSKHLIFLREKKDSKVERKKRIKPKEPIKKPIKKIKMIKTKLDTKVNENVKIKPFKVQTKPIDISAISSLNGAQIEMGRGFLDANSLLALKKVNPRYPRKAKIKRQEGFVQLAFNIDENGLVSNVKVLDSNPKGSFERNAIRAIKRWKFKKNEITRTASITFNFRLAR